MRFLIKSLIFLSVGIFMVPMIVCAKNLPEVKVFDISGQLEKTVRILDGDYAGSINFAVGDTWAGDAKELVVCLGAGTSSKAIIYNFEGSELESFSPFGIGFKGGCQAALGDTDGDLKDEMIIGPGSGGGPHIKVFKGSYEQRGFFALDKKLRTGIRVAAEDFGSDGLTEILAFSNYNQAPEYALFGNDGHRIANYKLKGLNNNGLNLVIGDFNGDKSKEIAYAGGYGNKLEINIANIRNQPLKKIPYANIDYRGDLNLAAGDVNNDGNEEIVVTEGYNGNGKVSIYNYDGVILGTFQAYDGFSGGLGVAVSDIDNDGKIEIITVPEQIGDLQSTAYKFATVDLSRQTAYRYQDGKLLDSFLISSGKAPNLTPQGEFAVFRKRPKVHMSGVGYDLPNVPWVTSFDGPITFHGTYWHSNFGQPMSHGCINMKTPEAKIVYDWSELGMPVIIY